MLTLSPRGDAPGSPLSPQSPATAFALTPSRRSSASCARASDESSGEARIDKLSRLEKLKGLPESLEEGVYSLPLEVDLMSCPPAFREQLEAEAHLFLDLSRLLAHGSLQLLLRIHETKAATTHVLLLTVPPGGGRLSKLTCSALKLGWPRVGAVRIFHSIECLDEELDYKIWMPRDYRRYFPNLRSVSYVAYNNEAGYFREMHHAMGTQETKAVVLRASQRHRDVLNLSSRLMRYMAHAHFLLTSLSLTINSEPQYPDYAFTVIRAVLLTDLAAPIYLRLNVDSTDLLYKLTENTTLRVVAGGSENDDPATSAVEQPFCKPSVRELTLRFREIGKLGIPLAARHFPSLERLVLNAHTDVGPPSLENTLYGCMFLERWQNLARLQLAHINDTLVQLLASSCPRMTELIIFNAAIHDELLAKGSFDIHKSPIPLPSMPSMRFTPKGLLYLLTRFPSLRVLDLNYPLYVDPLTRVHDIDMALSASLLRAVELDGSQYPRHLRYLSIPLISLSVHGISGIVTAFHRLSTLEVRLAAADQPPLSSRRRLLSRVKEAMPRQSYERSSNGRRPAELCSLWIWSDWSAATTTLGPVVDLFAQSPRLPRVYIPYVPGPNSQSEIETRLIIQYMQKEMPAVSVHRFEYSAGDFYGGA
ncbi:hypothetical protein H4R19_004647 [Coemansia spiralis]|nr:hypothetical protein H4R19_004647 [Coemansia spiralis]